MKGAGIATKFNIIQISEALLVNSSQVVDTKREGDSYCDTQWILVSYSKHVWKWLPPSDKERNIQTVSSQTSCLQPSCLWFVSLWAIWTEYVQFLCTKSRVLTLFLCTNLEFLRFFLCTNIDASFLIYILRSIPSVCIDYNKALLAS